MADYYLNNVEGVEFATDVPGWTSKKITATAAGNVVVKNKPGLLAYIKAITTGVTVTPYDGTRQLWPGVQAADLNFPDAPLACSANITLNFSAAGEAWVIYR